LFASKISRILFFKLSAVDSGENLKLKTKSSEFGTTFVAPVPPEILEI
jgi:hypothetical protein